MPSRPVAASRASKCFDRCLIGRSLERSGKGSCDGAFSSPVVLKRMAAAAHAKLSRAQTTADRDNPNCGTSQNAAASTPTTAPAVFAAYKALMEMFRDELAA